MRDPSGVHLNAAGRALARRVAAGLPRFDRVVTSPRPRAVESAEALGLSVDAELPSLAEMPDDAAIPLDGLHPRTFEDYVELVERSPAVGAYARGQSERWRVELERVPDGGLLLLISHGGDRVRRRVRVAAPGAVVGSPSRISGGGTARLGRATVGLGRSAASPRVMPGRFYRSASRTRAATVSGSPLASTERSRPALR